MNLRGLVARLAGCSCRTRRRYAEVDTVNLGLLLGDGAEIGWTPTWNVCLIAPAARDASDDNGEANSALGHVVMRDWR
jgi:hypothetical protein